MSEFIPYARQSITSADIEAVAEILRSPFLTQGPVVEQFEQAIADYCGAKYAVAVNSATSALHIACLAAGLGQDDVHWTTPNTFVASANCGLYCGAKVDFVDIDPKTYNMSAETLARKLDTSRSQGIRPKTLVPVAFAGQSCEMDSIYKLAKKNDIVVIEDGSHGIGGLYRGAKMGSGQYADMTIFSFHPVKILTTGEGGMVVTNDRTLYERLLRLRSHGITRNAEFLQNRPDGPWYYEQIDLGSNYRLTDIQAALGLSQMKRLPDFFNRRKYLVDRYNQALKDLPLALPHRQADTDPAWHLYVIRLLTEETQITRLELYTVLRERGIISNVHYIPVHLQPYYQGLGFEAGQFPEAEKYYRDALSIPLYFDLSDAEQDYVVKVLREILR